MNLPTKKFSVGAVQVAVWENQGKEGNSYYTVSFERRYKDKNDEWKSTSSLKANDLPKAILALQKTYEFLSLKELEINGKQEKELATTTA